MMPSIDNPGAAPHPVGHRYEAPFEAEALSDLFRDALDSLGRECGGRFHPYPAALNRAFVHVATIPLARRARPAARCGVLVQSLLGAGPVVAFEPGADSAAAPLGAPARFWPDGLAAFHTALGLYATLRAPDLIARSPRALELSLWWSIRENLVEEPGLATPFLELLAGERPNWRYWFAEAIGVA